ncbi:MAG: folate-binding protein YgfZ [Nocardioidaceae bacterium]|nr:folate-binding protein YgfZ [Nocardioidaceae bacterium]
MRWSSPLLRAPRAVEADGVDAGVAAHYGDPLREQKTLLAGDGSVDLSHREVVRIEGPDRLPWLHSLTTQFVEGLAPGQWVATLVLSPHGHVEHAMSGYDDGAVFWAHVGPGEAAPLVAWLDAMRFMMRVEVSDVTEEWAVMARGPESVELVSRAELEASTSEALCGLWAFEALRIARGEPRLHLDTDHRTIPNEVGWIGSAVHLDKGCYRGQETVARVHNLGRPPRRLVLLHLDGSADRLPGHKTDVVADGRAVGAVGTSARHHELGPIALALVKRNVDVGVPLLVDGIAASQEAVVDPDVGLHVRASR